MPKYTQTIRFQYEFTTEAKDASAANEILQDRIRNIEWESDVINDGYFDFEDEPVECPTCKGCGCIGDDDHSCERCNGDGIIPFTSNNKVSDGGGQ